MHVLVWIAAGGIALLLLYRYPRPMSALLMMVAMGALGLYYFG